MKGRTYRKRNRRMKQEVNLIAVNIACDEKVICLIQWMVHSGWNHSARLSPAVFPHTGRGLMAMQSISPGDVLVRMHRNLLITCSVVLSKSLSDVFTIKHEEYPIAQQILSTFLVVEWKLSPYSVWHSYVSSIPETFTLLSLYGKDPPFMPSYIKERLVQSKQKILKAFCYVRKCFTKWRNAASFNLAWNDFLWAWLAVNSRTVYIDPPKQNIEMLKDKDCLALAPYLDLFNHSPAIPSNVVGLQGDYYEIRSSANFRKYDQVFISYGPHDNLTLCLEYGFVVPENPFDFVVFSRDEVCDILGDLSGNVRNSEIEKFECHRDGFSWPGLCVLAKCFHIPLKSIYTSQEIKKAARKLIQIKSCALESELKALHTSKNVQEDSECWDVIKCLLTEHLNLLAYAVETY